MKFEKKYIKYDIYHLMRINAKYYPELMKKENNNSCSIFRLLIIINDAPLKIIYNNFLKNQI